MGFSVREFSCRSQPVRNHVWRSSKNIHKLGSAFAFVLKHQTRRWCSLVFALVVRKKTCFLQFRSPEKVSVPKSFSSEVRMFPSVFRSQQQLKTKKHGLAKSVGPRRDWAGLARCDSRGAFDLVAISLSVLLPERISSGKNLPRKHELPFFRGSRDSSAFMPDNLHLGESGGHNSRFFFFFFCQGDETNQEGVPSFRHCPTCPEDLEMQADPFAIRLGLPN